MYLENAFYAALSHWGIFLTDNIKVTIVLILSRKLCTGFLGVKNKSAYFLEFEYFQEFIRLQSHAILQNTLGKFFIKYGINFGYVLYQKIV